MARGCGFEGCTLMLAVVAIRASWGRQYSWPSGSLVVRELKRGEEVVACARTGVMRVYWNIRDHECWRPNEETF